MNEGPSPLLNTAMLRWLDELAYQGIFATDRDLIIRSWNTRVAKMTGRPPESVIGRALFDVEPELVARRLDRYYQAALEGQPSVLAQRFHGYLLRIPTPHGEMPQSCRVAPLIEGGAIVGTLTVIDDVTERVSSEAELRRQIASAEEARAAAEEALRAKDEFLATLSHELRTPLNAVLGWTNILLGRHADAAVTERALRVIERNAIAQARLIDDMLDMARIVTGKLRLEVSVVDLAAVATAALDVISPSAAAKNITIRPSFDPRPALINGDSARLQQIIWNVLSNAVKFTPPGGSIDVTLEANDDAAHVTIADSGKGISREFLPFVFDRFRQANSSANRADGGLGLGLALVRQLVDLHGGTVGVASEGPGRGSTFTISFPAIAADEIPAAPSRGHALPEDALATLRVLVVDDDSDWREALCSALQGYGAEVVCVENARDALSAVTSAEPPDVAVIDIGLPHEDGYTLLRQIRSLDRDVAAIPAIAVTAYAGLADQRQALNSGFHLFRAKPIAPSDVAIAIVEATRRSRGSSIVSS